MGLPAAATYGDLLPDTQIDGLTIVRLLGEGAMANLYLVRDETGSERVIKVPRHALSTDPVSLVAFENELRLAPYLADFCHAYMPMPQDDGEQKYLSMDYIRGMDLWSYLKQHGPLGEAETIALGIKIVHAVDALHRRRIVHLDLKLSNVMVTPDQEIRLIDFGLANHLDLPDLIFESFREPKGTPSYIAPEQFVGVRDEPRSDLFSVGVMLFELATGQLPYRDGKTVFDVIRRIKTRPVSPRRYAPNLSDGFEQVVMHCLYANPDQRFPTMMALGDALKSLRDGQPLDPRLSPVTTPSRSRHQRSSVPSLIGSYFRGRWLQPAENLLGDVERWADRHRQKRGPQPYRILLALKLGRNKVAHNDAILRQGLQLARSNPGAYLTIMSTISIDVGTASGEKESEAINSEIIRARRQIQHLLGKHDTYGLTINVNVVDGRYPADVIQQYVEQYGIDLVIIGVSPRGAFDAFRTNRDGQGIMAAVRCNVYVVQTPSLKSGPDDLPGLDAVTP